MRPMRTLSICCFLAGLLIGRSLAATEAPKVVVENLTNKVIAVLANKSLSTADKRRQIEDLAYASVDFDTLARLVLARNWSSFSPAQQQEFVNEFKKHLALTYGNNLDNYHDEKVGITGDQEEARGDWTVKSRILRGGPDDIEIDYRLRQVNGEWKIIDFIIEQVSLVANYRSQFQDILSSGTPDRLLKLLHERNAKGQPLKAPGKT